MVVLTWCKGDCKVNGRPPIFGPSQLENPLSVNEYRKNSNIIRTIFTKNRGLVAGVRIIHVN